MAANMLKLNPSKTEYMWIRHPVDLETLRSKQLEFGQDTIEPVRKARNIGVMFDDALTLTPHISSTTSVLHYHLRNISRIRPLLSRQATEQLVHALISSRLDYANVLLASLPSSRLRPLQLAQNTAARIVARASRRDHVTPLLRSLHWLPVHARVNFKLATLTFKALHGMAPAYLADLLSPYTPSRDLRSQGQGQLVVGQWRTQRYGRRRFSVAAPLFWNTLPVHIRTANDYCSFKRDLKTFLFTSCFN